MTDNIKLPLVSATDHPESRVMQWSALELAEINRLMREAVRLNAQDVADGWVLVPVQATPDMCKAAVIYANGNAVYKNVAHEALEIEESIYSDVYAAMLSAAPAAPQPAQPLTVPDALEKELLQAIQERDAAEDYIDALLDEVLGTDRPEWSSTYGHADAIEQVREMMNTLMKPGIDKAWDRFQSSVAPAAPQPAQPLDLGVMELAESVGLIGPASRADDLHEAIQRFHDLIVVNASIKAARHFADGLAQQPLTDEQCDAIYTALDAWARKADAYEFGLPRAYGDGAKGGREIIRNAISGVKND